MKIAKVDVSDWGHVSGDAEYGFLLKMAAKQQGIDFSKPYKTYNEPFDNTVVFKQEQ